MESWERPRIRGNAAEQGGHNLDPPQKKINQLLEKFGAACADGCTPPGLHISKGKTACGFGFPLSQSCIALKLTLQKRGIFL